MSRPRAVERPPTFDEARPVLSIRPLGVCSMYQRRLDLALQPLVRQGDGWAPFDWPASTLPWATALHRRWDSQHYAAQQPLLQEALRQSGRDLPVAGAQLYERDGRVISVSALTEGVATPAAAGRRGEPGEIRRARHRDRHRHPPHHPRSARTAAGRPAVPVDRHPLPVRTLPVTSVPVTGDLR